MCPCRIPVLLFLWRGQERLKRAVKDSGRGGQGTLGATDYVAGREPELTLKEFEETIVRHVSAGGKCSSAHALAGVHAVAGRYTHNDITLTLFFSAFYNDRLYKTECSNSARIVNKSGLCLAVISCASGARKIK